MNSQSNSEISFCNRTCGVVFAALLATLLQFPIAAASDLSLWKTYGATTAVRKVVAVGEEAWALTAGGIVRVNSVNSSVSILNNTDGLFANDFTDLVSDPNDDLWIGARGWLVRRAAADGSFTPFAFLDENSAPLGINGLADDDSLLWVAEERGLALFSKTVAGGQFMDSYQRFGSYPAKISALAVLLTIDSIWALTEQGLAVADRRTPIQLKSFANWQTFPMGNFVEVAGETPRALTLFNGALALGTGSDAYILTYDALDTTFISIGLPANTQVNGFENVDSLLRIYTARGVYEFDGVSASPVIISGLPKSAVTAGREVGARWFVGVENSGLYSSVSTTFAKVETGTIPGNNVRDLTVTPSGAIIGAFEADGFAQLENSSWQPIPLPIRFWAISSAIDSLGVYWLGTFGDGLWRVTAGDTTRYDTTNSTLRGNNDGGNNNFVVTHEIAAGSFHLFSTCYRAWDDNPVSLIDQRNPNNWVSFGIFEGVDDAFITSIDERLNRVVVSSENRGLYLVDPGVDPLVKSDYQVAHFSEEKSDRRFRIPSNNINVVRFDHQGAVWAGHRFGLAKFDIGIEWFVEVKLPLALGPEVRDLLFDPQGNLWIATSTGLGLFNRTSESFELFTQLNSGLVSDHINTIAFDPATNLLWIGTDKGISRFHPNIGLAVFSPQEATAYPNPFVRTFGNERLYFNFSGIAQVQIYTETGERIWSGESVTGWDGRNEGGAEVASGIYLFTLTVDGSEVGVGKFLLVRNR